MFGLEEVIDQAELPQQAGRQSRQGAAGANQQDPKVLYLTALALRESGDARQAAAYAKKAAAFDGLRSTTRLCGPRLGR